MFSTCAFLLIMFDVFLQLLQNIKVAISLLSGRTVYLYVQIEQLIFTPASRPIYVLKSIVIFLMWVDNDVVNAQ